MGMDVGLRGRRILVVEDDMLIAMMIEDMLTDLGCAVIGPANGLSQGQALADDGVAIDAALLDVNLGGESVFPLADRLRARGVPLIFSTGYGESGLRAIDVGCAMLRKPYRVSDVEDALNRVLASA
jgi:DNA-binding response OmpR family regulator